MIRTIEEERGMIKTFNEVKETEDAFIICNSGRISTQQLLSMLAERETNLQMSDMGGVTDQWRVYAEIIKSLSSGQRLRMIVQASAGTGKSYLMTTVMLWCIVNGKKAKAAAPTGIAASNIEIEGTSVNATTLHAMFSTRFTDIFLIHMFFHSNVRQTLSIPH